MTPSRSSVEESGNLDPDTVASFGDEWSRYDQAGLDGSEHAVLFERYFRIFPWETLPPAAKGFDMGCGSGRWAKMVAPRVGALTCIDPAPEALAVAKKALAGLDNVAFANASANAAALPEGSQDFGYSLGVLHHIPDTQAALQACTRLLKPGAPFLLYLYYRFDNRPLWFRAIWQASDLFRKAVIRLPSGAKSLVTDVVAATVYWPLARLALAMERLGIDPRALPLSSYRNTSFYTMRTDSRDRFGTPLEQRFTREEMGSMMAQAGLTQVVFSEAEPYWVAVGRKTASPANPS